MSLVWYQMTSHVYFEFAEVLIGRDIVLLFVGFHAAFKAVVDGCSFRCDSYRVVIKELYALHVVLESAIGKLCHV